MGKIQHRGPDDQGELFLRNVDSLTGLAHTRLSIIDLSRLGHQPMGVKCPCCQSPSDDISKSLWLVYNGEIYNYLELKKELEKLGHVFYSQSDSEVILHGYSQYGMGLFAKLNGIFAFALYDGRKDDRPAQVNQGDVILVRDGMGVKPLYYSETSEGILFSSELKSILCSQVVSRELDPIAVDQYLTYLWSPGERTMLKSVKKMLPGHAVVIRKGQMLKQWQYYDIPINQTDKTKATFDVAAKELREKLSTAVERQIVADVPIGAFLSGGLDSSAIVAMMRKQNPDLPIDCFSIRTSSKNNDGFSDDLPFAKKVAQYLNVKLHTVDAKPEMIQRLPEMLYYLDEPQADPAPINALLITELARAYDIKVLMSGAGGDDLFTGYRRHYALQLSKYWEWLPSALKNPIGRKARAGLSGYGVGVANAKVRRALKLLKDCEKSGDQLISSFFGWSDANLRNSLYSEELSQQISSTDDYLPLINTLKNIKSDNSLDKMLYLELKHFLVDHNLNYTDKTSMANGVEVRVPLLDPDLVKFAFTLPNGFKQKGRVGKAIFKKAMEPLLPHEVIYRPKTGFGAPLRRWLHNDLHGMVQEVLSENALANRGLFNPAAVSRLISLDKKGKADAAYTVFSILCIELWCRQFIDTQTPSILTF